MASEDTTNHDGQPEAGKALAPAPASGIDPFIAAAATAPIPPRGFGARLLDHSAHVAIIVGLIGFAWTLGSHLGTRPTAAQIEAPTRTIAVASTDAAAPAKVTAPAKVAPVAAPPAAQHVNQEPAKPDELAALRQANARMAEDIKALRANLDTLRTSVRQDQTASTEVHALEQRLQSVKDGLSSSKTETDAALAQLSGKVDKLQHEPTSKMQQLVDRLGRLERDGPDTTGSIGPEPSTVAKDETTTEPKAVPTPPVKPASVKLASAEDSRKAGPDDGPAKPQVLSGWVVRDVYDGVALIEGKRGPMEVVPGVSIPGAGVVRSIDRHGNGWTVTTSKGQLAYAAPPHDYRRVDAHRYYDGPYPGEY